LLRPRPCIEKISLPVHGGPDPVELAGKGLSPKDILDFSVSVNPFKLPRAVYSSLRYAPVQQYPDSASSGLIRLLAARTGCSEASLAAGSGSTELIRAAALAYLERNDYAVTLEPTYAEYELACHLCNATVKKFKLEEAGQFSFDADAFIEFARLFSPKAIFICNPNNPTGGYIEKQQLERILSAFSGSLLVLDEAYLAFTRDTWDSLGLLNHGNLLVIRSMTKDYGLAGLRLGYAAAAPGIIAALKKTLPPWNVNVMAQTAGLAVLGDDRYLQRQAARIQTAGMYLSNSFRRLGYSVVPSRTNFFMVRVGDAAAFRESLLLQGFLVRDCSSFGMPAYIRVAPRSLADCRKLVSAVKEMGGKP
jgi:histidinol-phosphate aminotransferase